MSRVLLVLILLVAAGSAPAASFLYRGTLEEGAAPAHGRYELRLSLYASPEGGTRLTEPTWISDVDVRQGRFELPVEFHGLPALLDGAWLAVEVRVAGESGWTALAGREAVSLKGEVCPTDWALQGNAGTDPALDFLGTTDAQPLELRTQGLRSLRLEPSAVLFEGLPLTSNVLAGAAANSVDDGVRGATIAGGGVRPSSSFFASSDPDFALAGPNRVSDAYGTVAGGLTNLAGNAFGEVTDAAFATVSGGHRNQATGESSSIGGGTANVADGLASSITGGTANQAAGSHATVSGGLGNCAGGDFSWAGGRGARVRFGSAASLTGSCVEGAGSSDANGDEGTFLWGDSRSDFFSSTGPDQFIVRASGGAIFQPDLSSGSARRPRGFFNVVAGDAGILQPAAPDPASLATFERNGDAFIRILAPSAADKGLLFGGPDSPDDGGISYIGPVDALEFRTGGAVNMRLSSAGVLQIAGLGTAGATSLCRNGANQIASCSSSSRYKHAIEDLSDGLGLVEQLRPVAYRWNRSDEPDIGLVAEEVALLDPRLVTYNAAGQVEGVKYERLSAVLANAVQELAARDAQREEELRALTARAAQLERDLADIRRKLGD